MKKILSLIIALILLSTMAFADSDLAPSRARQIKTDVTNFNSALSSADTTVQKALDTLDDGGGSGAPDDATYITQTANSSLSAEQALGLLATGIVKNTTTTGVLSIAAAGTDYVAPGGAGAITGLTLNYIPKAGSATTIFNSAIYNNGSQVTINWPVASISMSAPLSITDTNTFPAWGTNISPSGMLVLASSNFNSLIFVGDVNEASYQSVEFKDNQSGIQGGIFYVHSTDTMTVAAGGSTRLTIVGTEATFSGNVTASTNFLPDANDNAGLGTTALQFSDLFLAEGGVINFDNGDATITQVGNLVTLNGAALAIGSAGVSLTDDGDGALTFTSLGNGSLEDLTLNLDDTSNRAVFTTTTGLTMLDWNNAAPVISLTDTNGDDFEIQGNTSIFTILNNTDSVTYLTVSDTHQLTLGSENALMTGVTISSDGAGLGNLTLGTTGVRMSSDGDGAITFLGLGDGFDEDLTINLDDSTQKATFSSSTGMTDIVFSGFDLTLSQTNPSLDLVDTSASEDDFSIVADNNVVTLRNLTDTVNYFSAAADHTVTVGSTSVAKTILNSATVVAGDGELTATPVASTIRSPLATQQLSTVAGVNLTISASNAVAGSTNVGAAAGGALIFTGGTAARLTSGNAAGGAISITSGDSIGTSATGAITMASADGPSGAAAIGAVTIKTGSSNSNSAAPGAVGTLNIQTGSPATDSSASDTGLAGGTLAISLGEGGDVSGATTTVGGVGGPLNITGAEGGDTTSSGAVTAQTGGKGSTLTFTSGDGGDTSGSSGTRTGGNSGDIVMNIGAVGTGGTTNGSLGNYTIAVPTGTTKFTTDTNGVRAAVASAQTISAGNTIAADSCGAMKQITSAGAVTTDTTNTFTAPAAANAGCVLRVVNVGSNNITLDNNANFKSAGATDVLLTADDAVIVESNGTTWYQISAVLLN